MAHATPARRTRPVQALAQPAVQLRQGHAEPGERRWPPLGRDHAQAAGGQVAGQLAVAGAHVGDGAGVAGHGGGDGGQAGGEAGGATR